MYSEILATLKTHKDLKDLKDEIDFLTSSLYEGGGEVFKKVMTEKVRVGTSRMISAAFAESKVDRREFIKGLAKELENFKVFKLTLATDPTEKNINKIHEWVKENVGERIVLEISLDSSIVAGTIFSYEGEYRDLSYAKMFDEKYSSSSEEIRNILKS